MIVPHETESVHFFLRFFSEVGRKPSNAILRENGPRNAKKVFSTHEAISYRLGPANSEYTWVQQIHEAFPLYSPDLFQKLVSSLIMAKSWKTIAQRNPS